MKLQKVPVKNEDDRTKLLNKNKSSFDMGRSSKRVDRSDLRL
jgi:hypothetical protein